MRPVVLLVNGERRTVNASLDTPLLWVLRDHVGLTGTKFGCGAGLCGACTVHLDGVPTRSCTVPLSAVGNRRITTIEGLARSPVADTRTLHPLQQAWIAEDVPQCGYCQSGQLMAAAALLKRKPNPTDADIDDAMSNLCRCGTYPRIRAAIHRAAREMAAPAATQSGSAKRRSPI